ncbi:MAG: hypothetical protein LBJ00_00330 [Planctomycetaceae bacterium]|nr:hypothetical protein [Planctomycetaceae bacterium]
MSFLDAEEIKKQYAPLVAEPQPLPIAKNPTNKPRKDEPITVGGTVVIECYGSTDSLPIGGAIVFLVPQSPSGVPLKTVADQNGSFEFVFKRNGNEPFTLFAITPDKKLIGDELIRENDVPFLDSSEPSAPEKFRIQTTVRIFDREKCFSVTGTIKDVAGKPVEGTLIQPSGYGDFRSVSDVKGQFEIYTKNDFPHAICAVKCGVGFASMFRGVTKGHSPPFIDPLELVLTPPSPFRLVVVDARDMPVSDCEVTAICKNGWEGECPIPALAITDQNGVAVIDWKPKTSEFQFIFAIRPTNRLRRYADGSSAKLIPDPKKNIFYAKNVTSGKSSTGVNLNELKCVIPFKAEMKVKLINPFVNPNGKSELKIPNISAYASNNKNEEESFALSYDNSPDISKYRNDPAECEFLMYSSPRQFFRIRARLSDGECSVFPTVRGTMGDGFTPSETTITLQKGTPLRLRLFDENGNSLRWKQGRYEASISEIEPDPSVPLMEWANSYDFHASLIKAANAKMTGAEELVCYLPSGKFKVNTRCVLGPRPQQMYSLPKSTDLPEKKPKKIKNNQRIISIPAVPDGKEIILNFHLVDPNLKPNTPKK